MTINYGPRKTFEPENQFTFVCPIFKANVEIAKCILLRDVVYRGDKPAVRAGCQCAIHAGKCPIPSIVSRMIRDGSDPYHATDTKVRQLEEQDLDRVARVVVIERHINDYGVQGQELKLLVEANERAGHAPTRSSTPPKRKRKTKATETLAEVPAELEAPSQDEIVNAAISGDMSAAVNEQMKETE